MKQLYLLVGTLAAIGILATAVVCYSAPEDVPANLWARANLPPLVLGGILATIGAFSVLFLIKSRGLDIWLSPQSPFEAIVLYITPSRRIVPLRAQETMPRMLVLKDAIGRFVITEGSDYQMYGKKVYIGRSRIAHTIPAEWAQYTEILAKAGYKLVKIGESGEVIQPDVYLVPVQQEEKQ